MTPKALERLLTEAVRDVCGLAVNLTGTPNQARAWTADQCAVAVSRVMHTTYAEHWQQLRDAFDDISTTAGDGVCVSCHADLWKRDGEHETHCAYTTLARLLDVT